jgi:epoxyqueuosine reductase
VTLGPWLKERALAEGFDDAEVVPADAVLDDLDKVRSAVAEFPFTWMKDTIDQRLDIKKRLPWARSVLVVIVSYYPGDHELDANKAKVSRYAWGQDYHHVLRRKLRRLRKALLERSPPGSKCAPFNDVDAVLERAWATAAGLGFIGKSAMLIHRNLGTWTFLGGLVTDVDLGSRGRPLQTDLCGSCTACLDACPTHAIIAPKTVDANRCLVTWNVEEPNDPRGDAFTGHGWAVGCDVCQEVCPWNRFRKPTTEPRFLAASEQRKAFSPDDPPKDVAGTPLARPGADALVHLARRALKRP